MNGSFLTEPTLRAGMHHATWIGPGGRSPLMTKSARVARLEPRHRHRRLSIWNTPIVSAVVISRPAAAALSASCASASSSMSTSSWWWTPQARRGAGSASMPSASTSTLRMPSASMSSPFPLDDVRDSPATCRSAPAGRARPEYDGKPPTCNWCRSRAARWRIQTVLKPYAPGSSPMPHHYQHQWRSLSGPRVEWLTASIGVVREPEDFATSRNTRARAIGDDVGGEAHAGCRHVLVDVPSPLRAARAPKSTSMSGGSSRSVGKNRRTRGRPWLG